MGTTPDIPARGDIAGRYDANAAVYDDAARLNTLAARRLVDAVPPGVYPRMLDVGCGTGFATLEAVRRLGVREVTGVDISQGMLDRLREKLGAHPGVTARLVRADVAGMEVPDGAADLVVCCMALHWFADRAGAVTEMARALAPGGVLAVVAPGPGHDAEYAALLRGLDPPVPEDVWRVFDRAQVRPEEVGSVVRGAALEVLDAWVESRARCVPPERYMARIRAVGSHVWDALMPPAEQEGMLAAIDRAILAASGPDGWEYTFTKTFLVARRPA